MIYDKHIWYNPAYLLSCGFEAEKQEANGIIALASDTRKAINETRATCLWLLGVSKLHDVLHLVQPVDPRETDTPDTRIFHRTVKQLKTKKVLWGGYVDVEVVTYGEHSHEPLDEFLTKTKLALTKSYQADTVILCYINKDISGGKLWRDVHANLKAVKPQLETFLIGKAHPTEPEYVSAMVHPRYEEIVSFNVLDEAKRTRDWARGVEIVNLPGDQIKIQLPTKGFNPFVTKPDDLPPAQLRQNESIIVE